MILLKERVPQKLVAQSDLLKKKSNPDSQICKQWHLPLQPSNGINLCPWYSHHFGASDIE